MTRPKKNITKSLASAMTLGTSAVDSQLASWRVSVVPTSESVPTRPCTLREISAVLSEPNVANSDCTAPCAWARSPGRRSEQLHELAHEQRQQPQHEAHEHGDDHHERDERAKRSPHAVALEPVSHGAADESHDGAHEHALHGRLHRAQRNERDHERERTSHERPGAGAHETADS